MKKFKIASPIKESIDAKDIKVDDKFIYNRYRNGTVLTVTKVTEWASGEVESILAKADDGVERKYMSYEFAYFEKYDDENISKMKIDKFIEELKSYMDSVTGESPRDLSLLRKAVSSKLDTCEMTANFVEEVKDGRSSRFSVNNIRKLDNKTFESNGISVKMKVQYSDSDRQPSDSDSMYLNYYFDFIFTIKYS